MSYTTAENSQYAGAPYELFKFARDLTEWRYTTREEAITFNSEEYTPALISHSGLFQNNEDQSQSLEITLMRDDPFVAQFIAASAPKPVAVTVFRNHTGEAAGETKTIFLGQVSAVEYANSEVKVLCTSLEAAFTNPLARFSVQINCANMLYDAHCGVNQAANSHTGAVGAVSTSGLDVTVTGVPNIGATDSHYANGFLIYEGQYRFINKQVAGVMTLLVPFNPAPAVAGVIVAVAGCDRTAATCHSRHNNILRFGGFPHMPQRSPWERLV